ncbi:hypothetical protein [Cryptosporangium phraense]|uniref:GerMN domain-containing protein n=1 Tax=Cryptosporangium phraense TaxID=2593070 RepID=A0A545B053_9ACTN|nr:hypothetical protein [Cryptosporangium phraense]TQS46957.1 hypothetical protein FL583_01420 [Cryptosporangium phraense]
MRIIRTALLGLALLAAGCGAPATAEVEASAGPEVPSDDLVLRAEYTGGFVPPQFTYSRLPTVSVYADGRVITEGPQITIYPGPALPNVLVRTISRASIDRLVASARQAGVGKPFDYGTPGVADVPTTRFTLVDGGKRSTSEVYALGTNDEWDRQLAAAQRAARARMRTLFSTLTDVRGTGEDRPYRPDAVATIVRAYTPGGEGRPQPARAWRGAPLPGPVVGPADLHCLTATGAVADRVLADAAEANTETPWTSGGRQWSLTFRPLLPDESGCGSLGR